MGNKVKWVKLGGFIEQLYERNSDKKCGEEDAIGVNIDKVIRPMKGHLENKKFETFFLVRPGYFVYNPRGSRKLGLGYNDSPNIYITTFNNVIFHIKDDIKDLNPLFLYLYLSRKEWDRKAEYMSWGSSTEVFTWDTLCDVDIPLPSLEEQQKVVNAWKACREIKEQNEAKAVPLMQLCQSYIQELKHKYPAQEIGPYIEECNERNTDGLYNVEQLRGVTSEGIFDTSKAKTDGLNFTPYKIVRKGEFAYNPSRINLGSIAMLDEDLSIISPMYVVFKLKSKEILPEYLSIWYKRSEFQRSTLFYASGSVRDTFDFKEMKNVKIPLPPPDVQRAIVNIYKCANEAKQIAAEADRLSREVCPALLQHIIHN